MKRLMMMAVAVAAAMPLMADTETAGGYTWTYQIYGDTATILGTYDSGNYTYVPAIAPVPTGAVTIPTVLGGKPVTSIDQYAFYNCSNMTSVAIHDGITRIGYFVFAGCSGLTGVTIPNGVTSIGDYAFRGCSGLTSVMIGNSVTSIGYPVFSGCSSLSSFVVAEANPNYKSDSRFLLTKDGHALLAVAPSGLASITIPDNVMSIGDEAFADCSGLTSVTIPDSVTSIGYSAFSGCSGLTSVTIPDSVTSIGYSAFSGCSGLTGVTIPDSVTSIGEWAFQSCSGLASVTIGHGVTSIGECVFLGCSGLTSVTIPDGVTSIGNSAFAGCSGLTSVTIPDSVTSIGEWAFSGCNAMLFDTVTIPGVSLLNGWAVGFSYGLSGDLDLAGIRGIAGSAFQYCSGLTSVTIHEGAKGIGDYAFQSCNGLTSVKIPDSVVCIGQGVFDGSNNSLFDTTTILGVKLIDNWAIGHAGSLSGDLDLTGVRGIAEMAFQSCSGLTSVMIPDSVASIGGNAFSGCSGLTGTLTIPDGVKSIGECAFSRCSGLTGVTIPDGVKSIGDGAFQYCSGLTSVAIPDGVTSIGGSAFSGCWGLKSVTLGNGVTSIGERAFRYCDGLTSVTIPNTVTSIGQNAFGYCYNLTKAYLPKSLEGVVDEASVFQKYQYYQPVSVYYYEGDAPVFVGVTLDAEGGYVYPGVVTGLVGSAIGTLPTEKWKVWKQYNQLVGWFTEAEGGTQVTAETILTKDMTTLYAHWKENDPEWYYDWDFDESDGSAFVWLCGYSLPLPGDVVLPASLPVEMEGEHGNGVIVDVPVRYIAEEAFYGREEITSVTIPDGVKKIGWGAFADCSSITNVTAPASVTCIIGNAFQGCTGLADENGFIAIQGFLCGYVGDDSDLTIPDTVSSVGACAFEDCDWLTSVTMPNSVTIIMDGAFAYCSGLTNVVLSANLEVLGHTPYDWDSRGVFSGCYKLKNIVIPEGVTSIGWGAFEECSGLTSVTIGNSVTNIGPYAFGCCSGLTSVTIPDSVTSIGYGVFADCSDSLFDTKTIQGVMLVDGWAVGYTGDLLGDLNLTGVRGIEDEAFVGCSGLTSVTIPDSLTSIGAYVFYDCSGLTSVTIPGSVTSIGAYAFYDCSGLTSVTIPNGVTSIGGWAFRGCSGLTSVTIPDSVTSMGYEAFYGTALATVYVAVGDTDRVMALFSGSGHDVSGITFVEDAGGSGGGTGEGGGASGGGTSGGDSNPVTPIIEPVIEPVPALPVPVPADNAGTVPNTQFTAAQTMGGALFDANGLAGTVEVKLAKESKGEVKVSASAVLLSTGKKVAAKAVKMPVSNGVISGTLQFKDPIGAMAFSMNPDGTFTLENGKYSMSAANMSKIPSGKFRLDPSFSLSVPGDLQADLLPFEFGFTATAKKWTFPKNASVKVSKDKTTKEYGLKVDTTKGKTNLSSMKLTYKAKDGTFKGTFKAYAVETNGGKKKLKSYTVNVTGVVIDGVGYGEATLKSPKAGPWKVVVE